MASESRGHSVVAFQSRDVAVADLHFCRRLGVKFAVLVDVANADHLLECSPAHRACVHAKRSANLTGDSLEPLEATDLGIPRGIGELLLLHTDTSGDLAVAHVELLELAS